MKRVSACAAVSLVLAFCGTVFGAVSEGQFSVSPMIGGYTYYGSGQHFETAPMYSLKGGYSFTDNIGVEAGLDYSITNSTLVTDKKVAIFKYGVEGLYHFMPAGNLVPFLAVGLGGYNLSGPSALVSRKEMGFMDYGAGVKYFLNDSLALRADVRHILANASAFEYTLGVTIPFGGTQGVTKPVSAPAAPKPGAGKPPEKVAQEVPVKKPAEEQPVQKMAPLPAIPAIPEETPAPPQPAVKAMLSPTVVTPTEVVDSTSNMQLVSIPNACYTMGDPSDKTLAAHEVCLGVFSISKFEITREQFQRFVENSNYVTDAEKHGGCYTISAGKEVLNPAATWKNPDFYQSRKDPVVCVSWNDAQAYTAWLSSSSGKKYRLPTEAEWEFAARSGGKQEKYAGTNNDADLYRFANFCDMKCIYEWKDSSQNDGYWSTSPVGKYIPNGFGLYDMSGNVAEWMQDYFADDYYVNSPKMNPKGPGAGTGHSVRGGSWRSQKNALATTSRASVDTSNAYDNIGFRVCREP